MIDEKKKIGDEAGRIGVFLCACGKNIAGIINLEELENWVKTLPNVGYVQKGTYWCLKNERERMKQIIQQQKLDRIIIGGCSERTLGNVFRSVCEETGLNRFLCELVNVRDQCSWVHQEELKEANEKAKKLLSMGIAKVAINEPLAGITAEISSVGLVIGAGVAGMTAALELARRGFSVKLVEREEKPGGITKNLNKIYPALIDAQEFVEDKMAAIGKNPNIELLVNAEVTKVVGQVGNCQVTVHQGELEHSFTVGTIIVATGNSVFKPEGLFQYDQKKVITQMELEKNLKDKVLSAQKVVMIQCVGTRNSERAYCSRICCMTALKNALLIKELNSEARVTILYRDIQPYGPKYNNFIKEAKELGIEFIKYNQDHPPAIGDMKIKVRHELSGQEVEIEYDLVVLSSPLVPNKEIKDLAEMLHLPMDSDNFLLEEHVRLMPRELVGNGIYLAGSVHWPAFVDESVAQGYVAASRAARFLSQGEVESNPVVSRVDEMICRGCGRCVEVCEYYACELIKKEEGGLVSQVNPFLCKGCGICGVQCPNGAMITVHFTDNQIQAMLEAWAG